MSEQTRNQITEAEKIDLIRVIKTNPAAIA